MELLAQNESYVVCIKPVGMDSEKAVPEALTARLGGTFYPVHRLDRAVGGVMVYARTRAAAGALSRCVQEGTLVKEYRALVHGEPPASGDWEDLLWKDSRKNKVYVVKRMRGGVRSARLTFTRLEGSLVHIRLYTGRSHQIRVQFASRGYPLVGDHKYGARDEEPAPKLCSCRISFPWQGKTVSYSHFPDWAQV